ncbi:MAG: HAMP domain-containing sensor histidine kinase, partial [Acidobacteriota bacterium]
SQSSQSGQSGQSPPPNEMGGMWQLHIRHHAGSLEAAVASVRRRNLFISFGILALLGASVALMMLSSRRARRLAEQQMDFVAGISHELRTPLAVIDSAAYNLDKGVVKDPQQIKNYGALIRKETGRLTEMVEQVLEFAGVQSGRQQYDLQPASITRVIDDVLASSRQLLPLLNEGEFQLETSVAPDLPMVLADAQAMARALHNLLNNAMKYSGQSRWVGLRADAPSEKQVRIVISDRGLGIPEEDLPHIFEPFYRGHEARAAQIHGNGLGLSLVKNIIEAHGGQITVKSKTGEGSSFIVILPAVIEADRRAIIGAELPAAN